MRKRKSTFFVAIFAKTCLVLTQEIHYLFMERSPGKSNGLPDRLLFSGLFVYVFFWGEWRHAPVAPELFLLGSE